MKSSNLLRRVLFVLLITLGMAARSFAAEGPTPYPDPKDQSAWPGKGPIRVFKWMTENRAYFWSQRDKAQASVVLVGDSLTAGWKPEMFKKALPGIKIANRGIGGDVSRGVLFRFKEDVLDLSPKAVVLCIGTNDLSAHAKVVDIASNLETVLEQAQAHESKPAIVLCTVPPRDAADAPVKDGALDELNDRIRKLAEGRERTALLDLHQLLATEDGKPAPGYFGKDNLHLAAPAYEKWGEALRPLLEKLEVK